MVIIISEINSMCEQPLERKFSRGISYLRRQLIPHVDGGCSHISAFGVGGDLGHDGARGPQPFTS